MPIKFLNRETTGGPGRLWFYSRESWTPEHRWLPRAAADEFGRQTILLPIPFGGYMVYAWRTCHCEDCVDMRAQTERWDNEKFAAWERDMDIRNLLKRALDDELNSEPNNERMAESYGYFLLGLEKLLENNYDYDY